MNFLNMQRPMTDISHLKDDDFKEITCKCGCKRKARVLKSSKQKYLSELCKLNARGGKKDPQEQWRREMAYMVQG